MIDCLIMGDSIAVGVSQVRTECVAYAKSGINSRDFYNKNKQFLTKEETIKTGVTIISIGPNDTKQIETLKYANLIRERIKGKVYWILPSQTKKPEKFEIIKEVAAAWGDTVIERPADKISPDGVHPTYAGYKEIAEKTK
jgi:lysophospholipase L1-like esterase